MKIVTRAAHQHQKLPNTETHQLLDGQLILFLRSWGSSDYSQRFIDEVEHYMSSAQADIEVTTPFDYLESISSLANRTRVSLLLAHDVFYKNENKNVYVVGFEATVMFRQKSELAWSSVGRFSIDKVQKQGVNRIFRSGSDLDSEVLLPVQLVGVERELDISSGSLFYDTDSHVVVSSVYKNELVFAQDNQKSESKNSNDSVVDVAQQDGTYWFSVLSEG